MVFRTQFRDVQEWSSSTNNGIQLNTSSDVAAKWYDASLTQFLGWYEDETLGGMDKTIALMLEADPEFLLGRAFEVQLNLMGSLTAPHLDKTLANKITELNELLAKKCSSSNNRVNEQERCHVEVVNYWSKNDLKGATRVLERLVSLYPNDLAALKMAQDNYFQLGYSMQMRNSLAGSMPKLSPKDPLLGYAHGMFSFALEESNMYDESKVEVMKALELIPNDTWAIHNYAHCLEMQAKTEEGLKWMQEKKSDWLPCQSLACHQFWHTALFHINNDQFDDAISLLDNEVLTRCMSSASSLDLVDAASMIYRMELVDLFKQVRKESHEEVSKKRWSGVYDVCRPHNEDHLWGFNDAHFLMSYLGMDDLKLAREFIDTLNDVEKSSHMIENLSLSLVKPLLESMYQFKLKNYSQCVDILEGLRFEIIKIGGSHAQRDLFEQLLLVASLKSDKISHQKLGQRMLSERDHLQGRRTIQTDLMAKQAS